MKVLKGYLSTLTRKNMELKCINFNFYSKNHKINMQQKHRVSTVIMHNTNNYYQQTQVFVVDSDANSV